MQQNSNMLIDIQYYVNGIIVNKQFVYCQSRYFHMKLHKTTRNAGTSKLLQCTKKQANPKQTLQSQIKDVLQSINKFLKKYFQLCSDGYNLHEYKQKVKQFFVDHSTKVQYSCALSSLFSKLANMLQPFLHIIPQKTSKICDQYNSTKFLDRSLSIQNYYTQQKQINNAADKQKIDSLSERCNREYQLIYKVSQLEQSNTKINTKIAKLKQQLNHYKLVSGRLTNFVYLLRVNNIDVDSIYEKGCNQIQSEHKSININKPENSGRKKLLYAGKMQMQVQVQPGRQLLVNNYLTN